MKYSVIVTFYNNQTHLRSCIESVLNQSYTDFELILVNDGSTDDSLKIAKEYAQKDSRIILANKPNGGASSARNFGLELLSSLQLRDVLDDKATSVDSFYTYNNFNQQTKQVPKSTIQQYIRKEGNYIETNLEDITKLVVQKMPKDHYVQFLDGDDEIKKDYLKEAMELNSDIVVFDCDNQKLLSSGGGGNYICEIESFVNGLDIVSQIMNKYSSFAFTTCGVFKAEVLNTYATRFVHGIMHEDTPFGVILFLSAKDIKISKNKNYIIKYNQTSITTEIPRNMPIPQKLPSYLQKIEDIFQLNSYFHIKEIYKTYSYILMSLDIYRFIHKINLQQTYNIQTDLKERISASIYGNIYYAIKRFGTKFILLLSDRDAKAILTISMLQAHKKEIEDHIEAQGI